MVGAMTYKSESQMSVAELLAVGFDCYCSNASCYKPQYRSNGDRCVLCGSRLRDLKSGRLLRLREINDELEI